MNEDVKSFLPYNSTMAGKDAVPKDTVARIKNILERNGFEAEEKWGTSEVPYCHSLRIEINGMPIGANGKGVTKEFALASGYGELMERLQLGSIWRNKLQMEGGVTSCEAQSCLIPAGKLWEDNKARYELFAKKLEETTGVSITGQELLQKYADSQGNVQATAFYNLTTKDVEYLPTALCKSVYGTNGGAAGNTMEETMVQALSEIVERHHQLQIIQKEISLPDIDEETLKNSPIAYEIITFLRSKGYRVLVKDCSLGTGFPVLCVCLIDSNTGRYHTHFGAFPDFDIALQRTLTESFQGRNIHNVASYQEFFYNSELQDVRYTLYELILGTSEKSPRFFLNAATQSNESKKASFGSTNQERLKGCIEFFREQGYDMLVRDSSTLGFPTCQIIIPGFSEVIPQRMAAEFDDTRYSALAGKALRSPATATLEELMGVLLHISQSKKLKRYGIEDFTTETGLPAKLSMQEDAYLMSTSMAYISFALGKYKDAVTYLDNAIRQGTNPEYLICAKRYISMKLNKYTTEETVSILRQFHKQETVDLLLSYTSEKKNPLTPVVLQCDMNCSESCKLFGRCKKKQADALAKIIVEKAAKVDQTEIQTLLRSY